jgi:3-oxoacyl-[acyl-carrier protein] reductase
VPDDPRSVAGRVALVTGAASGMGRATAVLLSSMGAQVAALDREPIPADTGAAADVVVDLADRSAISGAVSAVREAVGPIDIVVNCAGISIPAGLDDPGWEEAWDLTIAVNLTAQGLVVRACADDLRRNGDGRVVNVASTEGQGATRYLSAYTASKHGVIGLTRALAMEFADSGVTVNCVCPGPIHTGMTAVIPDEAKTKFARRRVPMRRYGEPEEVAQMIASLVLPAASYTTGAVLNVDGGLIVQNT